MTAIPPRFNVWHPSRGISFSPPVPNKSPTTLYGSRPLSHSAPALGDQGTGVSPDLGKQDHDLSRPADSLVTDSIPAYPVLPSLEQDSQIEVKPGNPPAAAPKESEEKIGVQIPADPPYPALDYKISDELFRAAKKAAPGTPESYWSYSLYRGPSEDGPAQKPKVHYCRSKHTTEQVCQRYFANEKLLGFDLEWAADSPRSAGPRRNVSLIQLASPSRIALFHVALFAKGDDDLVAPTFKKIMEDADITKVGVWIKGDATRLKTHLGIESRGLFELSHLYRLVTYSRTGQFGNINKRLIPLATQVEQYLHLPMFKGQDVRSSDWTQPLTLAQVTYSASDAYAGVHLYATLDHHRKQLDPCPPIPHHAELNLPIRLSDGLDLETDSEDEAADSSDEDVDASGILSSAARKRALIAHLRNYKSTANQVSQALQETEKLIDDIISKDPRVEAADAWAEAFLVENYPSRIKDPKSYSSKPRYDHVQIYDLRAYHLWHTNKDLTIKDVAALLRTPPLKPVTVADYISVAVHLERLPVDNLRFSNEIARFQSTKYKKFKKRFLVPLLSAAIPGEKQL